MFYLCVIVLLLLISIPCSPRLLIPIVALTTWTPKYYNRHQHYLPSYNLRVTINDHYMIIRRQTTSIK